ncbi:unnamed protein product [Rhizoctonia solani]|uniref:Tyrosinase copper-binding domain-containing protein n=1 Tax=Rhizoctonia solani TaxID=456999 RepID=A0A8H3D1S1_9AGAM|nr:unnamed protein product [Rhizoctonia solani]
MYFSVKSLSAALVALTTIVAAVPTEKRATCTNPVTYVEWRSLPQEQRNSFHNAVKCLRTKPGVNGRTAFDSYPSVHDNVFSNVHYVANFLPWHRWFLHLRRLDLIDCGYTGPTPYWDWTIDSGKLATSNIWDPNTGFGGNGNTRTSAHCVENGPYANFQLSYPNRHCLARRFNNGNLRSSMIGNMQGSLYSQSAVNTLMTRTDYINFSNDIEEGLHDVIHNVIAGDMAAAFSPNDALFFLHHQQIDRLWAQWQGRNAGRLQDYRGNTVQGQSPTDGRRFPLAKLTDTLPTRGMRGLPDVTVADVMDTMSDKLCYVYDKSTLNMRFFALLVPLVGAVLAASPCERDVQCTNPKVRVEWRSLSQDQRNEYHKAIKCLQNKPSGVDGQSMYDRFSKNHVDMFGGIHYVAAFLAWHRYYSHARAGALEDCGYKGPTPYWDWTKDVNNMAKSEIFDPIKGFGGNGKGRQMCVQNGPYSTQSNFTLTWPQERCLQRSFSMQSSSGSWWRPASGPSTRHSQTQITAINKNKNFIGFSSALEEGPHDSVHNEINNDMAASFSPVDPLFFLHHNNVDRLWALWQGRDQQRLNDYAGNTVQGQSDTDASRYPLATLDDTIDVGIQGFPPVKVRDLMDTQGSLLCYKYDN